jgi:phosphate transport system protein
MAVLIQAELDNLKKSLLILSAEVEDAVQKSVQALLTFDRGLAEKVIAGDNRIDRMEVELEEECLKVMALHQPVAFDLRFIVSVLKINNDLERVADFACNIAARAIDLNNFNRIEPPYDIKVMTEKVKMMLSVGLDALMKNDSSLARTTIEMDEAVDDMHRENFERCAAAIKQNSQQVENFMQYLTISRYLERIGDLATNISEDLIYQLEGRIIRHGYEHF